MNNNNNLIGSWVRRFLMEHLIADRNLTPNTQASYRDAMILFLPFVSSQKQKAVDQLTFKHVTEDMVRQFLGYLEKERNCSIATRNQRLAAIHAWARFIGGRCPEQIAWCTRIRSVPFKKTVTPVIDYLEKAEMDALLEMPDRTRTQGRREYAMLLFLYNTGARADETAHATIADLTLGSAPSVRILGKGNKVRHCPLWSHTSETLNPLVGGREPSERIFLNRRRQPFTRFGVYSLVKRSAEKANKRIPSLRKKKVGPHTIRHTTAVHLLRSGVDLNTIRAWLGHVSLDTTHIYAEIDLEMKAEALAHCKLKTKEQEKKRWKKDPNVIEFLKSL